MTALTHISSPQTSSPQTSLPRAALPFVEFASLLRAHGFRVAPEQTMGFIEAIGLLGPRSIQDVRRAGHAVLAPPPERLPEFDALFDAFFIGHAIAAPAAEAAPDEDDTIVQERREDGIAPEDLDDGGREVGAEAARAEALTQRRFAPLTASDALRQLSRAAPDRLPRRKSYRRSAAKAGDAWHLRRMLREAARRDGEVFTLPKLRRKTKLRRILLLIDVSGSMKAQTDGALRFAHALARAAEQIEIFTFGTRLTRITPAMRLRRADHALAAVSDSVWDWDGGTRIGDALQAFLAIPRFAGFARGAYVLVLSDGLERDDPQAMIDAVRALSRRAWAVDWLTPLAADPGFAPRTAALAGAAPHLAQIADGSDVARLCAHVLERGPAP